MIRKAFLLVLLLSSSAAFGQESPPSASEADAVNKPASVDEAPIHDELRALRERMFAAYEKRNIDQLLTDIKEDVLVTWQNGERNLSKKDFLAFYDKMMNGEKGIVKDVKTDFTVDGMSRIYGDDTAVAYGTSVDHFVLKSGSQFDLKSIWTCTLIKDTDGWKIAAFHTSTNIFDNPILGETRNWIFYTGIIAVLVGLALGYLIGAVMRKPASGRAT